jgi:hypothetical protein
MGQPDALPIRSVGTVEDKNAVGHRKPPQSIAARQTESAVPR